MTKFQPINPIGVFDSLQFGFSQALVAEGGRRMMLSGQIGVDADFGLVEGGIEAQARKAFDNIALLLGEVGADLSAVVMLRIYIAESARNDQGPLVDVLKDCFPTNPPPSSWIVVAGLSQPEWLIEIEAEAVLQPAA